MKPWPQRPIEEANLLNPAFCCVALASSVAEYASVDRVGMPYPLVYLVLAAALHKPTRIWLPRTTRTTLGAWLQEHADARVGFAERVIALKPYCREAILFGALRNWLTMTDEGRLLAGDVGAVERAVRVLDGEARECTRAARLVGRWFARAGTPQTVMAYWGVRP